MEVKSKDKRLPDSYRDTYMFLLFIHMASFNFNLNGSELIISKQLSLLKALQFSLLARFSIGGFYYRY